MPDFCEILAGLSTPIPLVAVECLPAALDVAHACVARLDALGHYAYNLSGEESHRFALARWTDAAGYGRRPTGPRPAAAPAIGTLAWSTRRPARASSRSAGSTPPAHRRGETDTTERTRRSGSDETSAMNGARSVPEHDALRRRSALLPLAALATLFVVLLLPAHPRDVGADAFLRLPLELPLVVLALLALPPTAAWAARAARLLRLGVVLATGTLLLLRLADLGSYLAFSRPFSPLVELHLLGDGWNLASRSVGRLEAGLAVVAALMAFGLLCTLLYRGLGALSRLRGTARVASGGVAAFALLAGLAIMLAGASEGEANATRVQADLGHDLVTRVQRMRRSIADQTAFVAELAADPVANPPPTFGALAGRDVVLVFVESYGRSFVDGERFRGPARARLARVEDTVERAGLHARSAWLTSPIRGGRSWLAHASVAAGLAIGSQARFDRLVASPRKSLNRLFAEAGWRTAGLMPAIQLDWPEGEWYGFDDTRDAHRLGYAGEPFGWVTMPDQYTLAAFERLVREPEDALTDGEPVMAEIALISSHAPWTPLAETVPWEAIGDGRIFDGSHRQGDSPAELWADRERLREHYARSLDYSLDVLGSYLERHGRGALFVILGDHQPPSVVAGWDATADVPVHLVSDDPELLERLPADLWSVGMRPAEDLPSQPMASLRATLVRAFETASPPPAAVRP